MKPCHFHRRQPRPSVGIFYVSFLPQFIPQGHSLIVWTLGLVSIHVLLGLL